MATKSQVKEGAPYAAYRFSAEPPVSPSVYAYAPAFYLCYYAPATRPEFGWWRCLRRRGNGV
jgi:hypothetical protein